MRLAETTVLVTGASGGIGGAVATGLAQRGARVVVHGRDPSRTQRLAVQLDGVAAVADLSELDGIDTLLGQAGPVDAVVHAAGIGWWGPVATMTGADAQRVLSLDLCTPIELTRRLLPVMIAAGRGHVCFVASIAGATGVAHEAVYSAAKAGLLTFADALRLELVGSGVEVSTVAPGLVATGFTPPGTHRRRVPRPIPAQRVAAAVIDAMSGGPPHRVLPRWLALAPAVRAVSPAAYRHLAGRFGAL